MITQAMEIHMDVLTPTSNGQKHGHMNSAVFYILDGNGYDVHDGVKHPWKAGDVCIVENMCVHQHFNSDPLRPVRFVMATNRLVKELGFDLWDQVENAHEYKGK